MPFRESKFEKIFRKESVEKEKPKETIAERLKKLTAQIERAIIERMMVNPDALAAEKDFEKIDKRLRNETEVLAKRYEIEDEIDEKGNVTKEGSEKILETIGYDYDETKKYPRVRRGDLINYERNALFKMWNLPAEENDIERFKEKIGEGIKKKIESKKFKKFGISKEEISKAIHFDEIDYERITKEDLLFLEYAISSQLNRLKIDKKGEIKPPGAVFWESPKSKWLKTAFAVGVPTLLMSSIFINVPRPGKEKPVSLQELEKNPDLLNNVPKEVIFRLIAPNDRALTFSLATDETTGRSFAIPIKLYYEYDQPFLSISEEFKKAPPEYYEEMKKIGLHITQKTPDIPLFFYLKNKNKIDEIVSRHYNISPKEITKIDSLIKISELTDKMKDVPILSWENFSIGPDTPENIEKISEFKKLLDEGYTYSESIPFSDPDFPNAIEKLLEKEGYNETKLKEIAKENPKNVIEIVAQIIDKNVKYDYELNKLMKKKERGEPLSLAEAIALLERTPTQVLEKGGICGDISRVMMATSEYLKSKEILPENLLFSWTTSEFENHGFNSVFTIDSSGKLVSTYIDVTWFAPEEIGKAPYLYDLSAVDYYHKLGLSVEDIQKIMSARFSEYLKWTKDISTYDPWLHKKEREIIWNQKEKPSEK